MEKRYRALRIIATFYKIAGALVLAFALLAAVGLCLAGVLGGTALEGFNREFGDMRGMGDWWGRRWAGSSPGWVC
jgi:hypothetical protein